MHVWCTLDLAIPLQVASPQSLLPFTKRAAESVYSIEATQPFLDT